MFEIMTAIAIWCSDVKINHSARAVQECRDRLAACLDKVDPFNKDNTIKMCFTKEKVQ